MRLFCLAAPDPFQEQEDYTTYSACTQSETGQRTWDFLSFFHLFKIKINTNHLFVLIFGEFLLMDEISTPQAQRKCETPTPWGKKIVLKPHLRQLFSKTQQKLQNIGVKTENCEK